MIINYPTLSAAIWGSDWMDGSSEFRMMLPFWEVFQMRNVLMDLVDFQYSWNIGVNSYSIFTIYISLDLHFYCESNDSIFVVIE